MEQKTKDDSKLDSTASLELPAQICNSRCKVCHSNYLKEIHRLKKAGHTYARISVLIKKEFNLKISSSSICRHFHNYQKHKNLLAAQIIDADLVKDANQQATHTKKLLGLINEAFASIKERVATGNIILGIDSLDKLMKLKYQVLAGQATDEEDILAIFQKASSKYGFDVNQGVLFKPGKKK